MSEQGQLTCRFYSTSAPSSLCTSLPRSVVFSAALADNLFTGARKNIEHWIGHPNFTFFQHDVIHPFFIEVNEIYHLACPASPPHYQYNPIKVGWS